MSNLEFPTHENSILLTNIINNREYDPETRKIAVKCVELLLTARLVKIMSGREYATGIFRELNALESEHEFYDAFDILEELNNWGANTVSHHMEPDPRDIAEQWGFDDNHLSNH